MLSFLYKSTPKVFAKYDQARKSIKSLDAMIEAIYNAAYEKQSLVYDYEAFNAPMAEKISVVEDSLGETGLKFLNAMLKEQESLNKICRANIPKEIVNYKNKYNLHYFLEDCVGKHLSNGFEYAELTKEALEKAYAEFSEKDAVVADGLDRALKYLKGHKTGTVYYYIFA